MAQQRDPGWTLEWVGGAERWIRSEPRILLLARAEMEEGEDTEGERLLVGKVVVDGWKGLFHKHLWWVPSKWTLTKRIWVGLMGNSCGCVCGDVSVWMCVEVCRRSRMHSVFVCVPVFACVCMRRLLYRNPQNPMGGGWGVRPTPPLPAFRGRRFLGQNFLVPESNCRTRKFPLHGAITCRTPPPGWRG